MSISHVPMAFAILLDSHKNAMLDIPVMQLLTELVALISTNVLTVLVFAQIIPLALIMTVVMIATVIPVTKSLPTVTMFAKMSTNVQALMSWFMTAQLRTVLAPTATVVMNVAAISVTKANAECTNNEDSFDCACKDGFGTRIRCTDIDECAAGLDNCAELATCTNTAGSFECTCPEGYNTADDGVTCQDVDE